MHMTGKKWSRYFAILVALVILTETIAFTVNSYAKNDTNAVYELTDEDKTTVSEISNMTGVKADKIIKLRKEGKSWNEILEHIKNNPGYRVEGDGITRKNILAKNGLEEDTFKKLKGEGYTGEQISEAKSLMERAVFQLDEISNMQKMTPKVTDTGANDITAYTALAGKINPNEAVYLILKLHDELKSLQSALDEYLCSLQLDIDLKLYFSDKEEYKKQKQQKMAELAGREIITTAGIEEKMLDMLMNMNAKDEGIPEINTDILSSPGTVIESSLPDITAPDTQDIKPQNPADAIMQEINGIIAGSNEQDGR